MGRSFRKTPDIEAPTGSPGQGLSYANGSALAARLDGLRFNLYLIMGGGELQEGQPWEAAMTTAHHGLKNVCVLIDRNGYRSQGCVSEIMNVEPLKRVEGRRAVEGGRCARPARRAPATPPGSGATACPCTTGMTAASTSSIASR
jgi:hypothetical protein